MVYFETNTKLTDVKYSRNYANTKAVTLVQYETIEIKRNNKKKVKFFCFSVLGK